MAFVTSRFSSFNVDGIYGEPEQDANSALTDLDKGLRSMKVGEQCEAIVRFPRLFEKYPFPILINSAFLKLADVFRIGNNFLRFWILKVTQQSEKHLDKILNIDEYVKRLYSVIYSNDPLARALTLRTLGSIACIIPERKNVHHSIRDCFDSHDAVELEAAVYAAEKFSKYSKDFAGSICYKIEQMIQKLSTPVEMKLKLIPILQNMHHDADTSSTVRQLCTHLLNNYPAEEFLSVTLHTLTNLSASTMVDIPDQVKLLIDYLQKDSRISVKKFILKELKTLAIEGAHFWDIENITSVSKFAKISSDDDLLCYSFEVLVSLAGSSEAATKLLDSSNNPDCSIIEICQECSFSENPYLASLSIKLHTLLALYDYQINMNSDVFDSVTTAIECLLIVVSSKEKVNKLQISASKRCLYCVVQLCKSDSDLCHRFIDTIGDLSMKVEGSIRVLLLEGLCAVGNIKVGVLSTMIDDLVSQLKCTELKHQENSHILAKLCTLLFQAMKDRVWLEEDEKLIINVVSSSSSWDAYKIGRQAARYGHHYIAAEIFSRLATMVGLEHHHFWLVSLVEICKAETLLQKFKDDEFLLDNLNFSLMHYMKGISALKAATTPAHQMDVQYEMTRLRSEMLKAFVFLIQTCNTLRLSPPPAIAASMAIAARDDLQRSGRVVMQLRKAASDFHKIASRYKDFSQAIFNADPVTLKILKILQFNCLLVAHAISSVVLREANFPFDDKESIVEQLISPHLEVESMSKASCRAANLITNYLSSTSDTDNISYKQINVFMSVITELLKVSISFPRYFFQTLQSTSIKLAISPQQRGNEPVTIINTSHLAVKVEGIVQYNLRPGAFRDVSQIQLSVSSVLTNRASNNMDAKIPVDTTNSMKQVVTPHNDYFSAQFLLAFPIAGLHTITVVTSVIDQNQEVWNTGPRSSLSIKALEDPSMANKSSQQATAHRHNFSQRF